MRGCFAGSAAALLLSGGWPASAQHAPEQPISPQWISRADATAVAQAALEACAARGQPASVVVWDADGFQRAAFSDDGAKAIGLSSSAGKAAAVLAFKASTRDLQARVASDKAFADQYGKDERYHFSPGGLPLYRDGKFVAILAVGGARNIDEDCAREGLKRLAWASTTAAGY